MASDGKQKRDRIITLALLAILLMSVSLFLSSPKEADTIVVTFPSGTTLETEVADTPEKMLELGEEEPPSGALPKTA